MFRREPEGVPVWALAAGTFVGVTAVSLVVLRMLRRRRQQKPAGTTPLDLLEESAVDALRRDARTGRCAIDVAAIAPGIVELTGIVPTHELGQRAARLLHALPGVRTVINRLETGTVEERLAENRRKRASGAPASLERQWYGVRVGTGRRRQSADTDPARTDDTVKRRTRELEISAADMVDGMSPESPEDVVDPNA